MRVTGTGVDAVVDGCHKLQAFDISQCKNVLKWLEAGGLDKSPKRVVFQTVAGDGEKSL